MNSTRLKTRLHSLVLIIAIGCLAAAEAAGESDLRIPYPENFGVIAAATYDEQGRRVGGADLNIELLENGNVTLRVRSGFDGGAQQIVEAELAPFEYDGTKMLRLLRESSRSFDPDGKPLVVLQIDHQEGRATCTPPTGKKKASNTIDLPQNDRVANVPLNLLFTPLALGEIDKLDTQVFFCLGGARLMKFAGRAVDAASLVKDDDLMMRKIIYEPNVSVLYNWAAKALAPKIMFWFDAKQTKYLAHRLPLYTDGPVVYVIREGISPRAIIESAPNGPQSRADAR